MKPILLLISCLGLLPLLSLAKDENKEPQLKGLWRATDEPIYMLFQAGDKCLFFEDGDGIAATWKKDPENGKIHLSLMIFGAKADTLMEVKFTEEDKAEFIGEGDTTTFIRFKGLLDEKKAIGVWKASSKEDGSTSHTVDIRTEDGKGFARSLSLSEKDKTYCIEEKKYLWGLSGDHLIETYDAGTDDEIITLTSVKLITPDKLLIETTYGEDNMKSEYTRSKDDELPKPPKDYKKVSPEKFWEHQEEVIEEDF